jgi:hypothetical protein
MEVSGIDPAAEQMGATNMPGQFGPAVTGFGIWIRANICSQSKSRELADGDNSIKHSLLIPFFPYQTTAPDPDVVRSAAGPSRKAGEEWLL